MRKKLFLILALTLVMATLVVIHVKWVNGPWYWKWSWRRLPWWTYGVMLAAAVPFAVGQWLYTRGKLKAALVSLTLGTFVLQLAALCCQPAGFNRLLLLAQNTTNTSYYTDAKILNGQDNISMAEVLFLYPRFVNEMHVHARYKPPGLILYYTFWIKLLGPGDSSAWAGGIGVAMLAALAVPAFFWMMRFFGRPRSKGGDPNRDNDNDAAFFAASFLSLSPSLILFCPQFDQTYVTLACVILTTWGMAARDLNWKATIACGVLLAVALFCSYIFLTLGCFIVIYWLFLLIDKNADHWIRAAVNALVVVGVVVLLYAILGAATGFDPIDTFWAIARVQMKELIPLVRPFPEHIFWDLLDFGLGSGGWISYLLVIFYLARTGRAIFNRSPEHRLVLIALIQVFTVAFAALLPGEVARLWMLMIPLLLTAVGFELAHWTPKSRWIVFACLWLMLTTIGQNMSFLYMGEELDGPRQYDTWPKPGPGARR